MGESPNGSRGGAAPSPRLAAAPRGGLFAKPGVNLRHRPGARLQRLQGPSAFRVGADLRGRGLTAKVPPRRGFRQSSGNASFLPAYGLDVLLVLVPRSDLAVICNGFVKDEPYRALATGPTAIESDRGGASGRGPTERSAPNLISYAGLCPSAHAPPRRSHSGSVSLTVCSQPNAYS